MAFWDIKVFRHVFFAGYLVVFGRCKEAKKGTDFTPK
jgi:hypothetical protein